MENRFSRKRSPRLEGKRWIGCWADHSPSSSFCKSKLSEYALIRTGLYCPYSCQRVIRGKDGKLQGWAIST